MSKNLEEAGRIAEEFYDKLNVPTTFGNEEYLLQLLATAFDAAERRGAESVASAQSVADSRVKDSFGNDLVERELVSIILRMTRFMPDDKPAAKKLHDGAIDYLQRKSLLPSPLRADETVVQSEVVTTPPADAEAMSKNLEEAKKLYDQIQGGELWEKWNTLAIALDVHERRGMDMAAKVLEDKIADHRVAMFLAQSTPSATHERTLMAHAEAIRAARRAME